MNPTATAKTQYQRTLAWMRENGNTASGPRNSNDDQSGGGVANRGGTVTITNGTINGNTAASEGGGLWNAARGRMTISGTSTINILV